MLRLYVRVISRAADRFRDLVCALRGRSPIGTTLAGERGQTTAEYALVILAAAAVALVLIAWARSSGKLPEFFDKIIDDLINSAD